MRRKLVHCSLNLSMFWGSKRCERLHCTRLLICRRELSLIYTFINRCCRSACNPFNKKGIFCYSRFFCWFFYEVFRVKNEATKGMKCTEARVDINFLLKLFFVHSKSWLNLPGIYKDFILRVLLFNLEEICIFTIRRVGQPCKGSSKGL